MPVNSEGEIVNEALSPAVARMQNDLSALTNLLTVATKRHGAKTDDGKFELSITAAELSALGDLMEVATDKATGAVLVRVTPKSGADIVRDLSAHQKLDNARASMIALPKSGLILP
jgi:hypothetical protein